MERIHKDIVAAYLYIITRHGYPPKAKDSLEHLAELKDLEVRNHKQKYYIQKILIFQTPKPCNYAFN